MKKTKRMIAALMSSVMLGSFSVVQNMVYAETAETDESRAFTALPEDDFTTNKVSPTLIDGLDGDASIDGDMDISDAVMVMQSLANPDKYGVNKEKGITYQGIKNVDTNKDGITNADALIIQKKLLKLD